MADSVSLDDLGVQRDPGTEWHPSGLFDRIRDVLGVDLDDLDDDEVADHRVNRRRGLPDEDAWLEAEG